MLMPRLIAGENNIDAINPIIAKAQYNKVDEFVADLRHDNPRLAEAMQRSLFGLADSNDLKVLVTEANAIATPKTPKEKVLVGYVEKVIKEHYRDQARQASIIDYLGMRNVTFTGSSFYTFGEVVKRDTDSALKALLSGTGDFNLVGSNDVHQMFGYYQDRHGGRYFADVHEPSKRDASSIAPKKVRVNDPEELRAKREEVTFLRNADTKIPRISTIFTEICAYEYLLTQGSNIVKDKNLASHPHALASLEMVNNTVQSFTEKLALEAARKHKQGEDTKKSARLGTQVESLIAQSFVDFFSELGAVHSTDALVSDRLQKVKNAYKGENFSLANASYTEVISEKAEQSFGLFLEIYQHNLKKYLEVATQPNKKALLEQLDAVKDIMQAVQPAEGTGAIADENARLRAYYRNHSLGNAGVSYTTWVSRADSIHNDGKKSR